MKLLYLFLLVYTSGMMLGFAQSAKDFEENFEQGKKNINEQKFKEAQSVLAMTSKEHPKNRFVKYGSFLYAYAAFKNGDTKTARSVLLSLSQKYPEWNKVDEVYYLLACIDLEAKKGANAYRFLNKIENSSFAKDITDLKNHFLPDFSEQELQLLQASNPQDTLLAQQLAYKILGKDIKNQNKELLAKLGQNYNLTLPQEQKASVRKERYNVAVMMPFFTSKINTSSSQQASQHLFDLYNGMRLAQEQLVGEGIDIELVSYDTERSRIKTRDLLAKASSKNVDLILGPLFPATVPMATEFAEKNNINVVLPLSHPDFLMGKVDTSVTKSNLFLCEPTFKSQARATVDFMEDSLTQLDAYIIYSSNSLLDSLKAVAYREEIERKGGKVVVFEGVKNRRSYQRIQKILQPIAPKPTKVEFEDRQKTIVKIHKKRDVHIFVSTSEPVIGGAIISILKIGQVDIPLIISPDWLKFSQMSLESLENRSIYMVYPNFVDRQNSEVVAFNEQFLDKIGLVPITNYAFMGYESLYFFGKMLNKYGTRFDLQDDFQNFQSGKVLQGMMYGKEIDNQFVPILKLKDGVFQVQNLPEQKDEKKEDN